MVERLLSGTFYFDTCDIVCDDAHDQREIVVITQGAQRTVRILYWRVAR